MTSEQKERYKNKIITDLYNSGEIQKKIDGILYRNHVKKDTHINQDCYQETFYWLSRVPADQIIEMYEDDISNGNKEGQRRLVGLSVRIACWKCVAKNKNPKYPKHSLVGWILFGSNFQQHEHLSPTEHAEDDSSFVQVLMDESTIINEHEVDVWSLIRSNLTPDENKFLNKHLNVKKGQGRYKKEVKEQLMKLQQRIKEIIEHHKIII